MEFSSQLYSLYSLLSPWRLGRVGTGCFAMSRKSSWACRVMVIIGPQKGTEL